MNRKLIYIIAILIATLSSMQAIDAQSVKASFGIKGGGVTTIMPSETPTSKFYINGYGGLFLGLRLGKVLGIQAEADYSLQGAHYSLDDINIKTSQQYLQIPLLLQIWAGRSTIFEVGYQQSILLSASLYEESEETLTSDPGAHEYYGSILAGVTFNLGKVVFLNFRYTYGISNSYSIYSEAYPSNTIQIGLGFRLYNSRRTIYK